MSICLIVNKSNPDIGALLLKEYVKKFVDLKVEFGQNNSVKTDNDVTFTNRLSVYRYLSRAAASAGLYGNTVLEKTEVDHWLEFSNSRLTCQSQFYDAIQYLDRVLESSTFLVARRLTLADIAVWATLKNTDEFAVICANGKVPNQLKCWFDLLSAQPEFVCASKEFSQFQQTSGKPKQSGKERKDEGKFIDLPGAEMGKVVVRFPPEASGYLHIGHAKAALLNQFYQNAFNGTLIMRFDDTNPEKEKADFEKVILEDMKMLDIVPDKFTHTSDHFDKIIEFCEKLLKEGKAYVDDTSAEQMKLERDARQNSVNHANSVEKNLLMWNEMKRGTEYGQTCCVRAKIDMQSDNGALRDPAIYRCKNEEHVRTGFKYKVYPTYDFACPIVDSLEGVTHALRTTEYHDRDDQYYWFIDALELPQVYVWEYSRLSMMNTVLSKRKLTWFVSEGLVDGWDDPRMPTVRGVLRRGMTVEGLKQFIVAQGSSRSIVMMDWDKIWSFNKKVVDPVAPRFTALEKQTAVRVTVSGTDVSNKMVAKHPKNPDVGEKMTWYGPTIYIEGEDAETLKEGEIVTFINWGNLIIKTIHRDKAGRVTNIEAELNLENKDFKKTTKLTWLADVQEAPFIPTVCVNFDHIISKTVLAKEDNWKDFVNGVTRHEQFMLGDPELATLRKGSIIQLQRRGYYICDEPYRPISCHTGRASPCILFNIPDGKETAPSGAAKGKSSSSSDAKGTKPGKKESKKEVSVTRVVESLTSPDDTAAVEISANIVAQGNIIRNLKSKEADREEIDKAVKVLLDAKAHYKSITGKEWKPGSHPEKLASKDSAAVSENVAELDAKIREQGDEVRKLKAERAEKVAIDGAVKYLLDLKAEFKRVAGCDWKPDANKTDSKKGKKETKQGGGDMMKPLESNAETPEATALKDKINAQGNKVRELKANKADKAEVDEAVQLLVSLKSQYKNLTQIDLTKGGEKKEKKKTHEVEKLKKGKLSQQDEVREKREGAEIKHKTRLGLEASKEENLPDWYSQVITKAEMIEYYDVSGCYILRPWSFSIWERIQSYFDTEIKKLGVQNVYFPIFVSRGALEKEKTHIADFAPEVAWVTKSGQSDLAEPIAIRPTSETVMYPAYAKWIKSHRDLPMKLNQWNNVVRWEFKHPQPFLRTREFLWQEGHTAYADYEGAVEEVHTILELYANIYEKLLAIPVVRGRKTEKEKFAGADFTTTIEAYISASGRAIQGGTSHHLGQNFSKMFEIVYEDPETQEKKFVFQNSWGLTTRSIGVMCMVHGDNIGLVLPPKVAAIQIIIIPCGITVQLSDEDRVSLIKKCKEYEKQLNAAGIRCKGDYRDNYSPGWKFNHWELKGVPVRFELGPRDQKQQQFVAVRRDTGEKCVLQEANAVNSLNELLETIQSDMFSKAENELKEYLVIAHEWNEFCDKLDKKCLIQAPFCGDEDCEAAIKNDSARDQDVEEGAPSMGAKSLCIPFDQPGELREDMKCVHPKCMREPKVYCMFGRSY